jgi:hypothetical protein
LFAALHSGLHRFAERALIERGSQVSRVMRGLIVDRARERRAQKSVGPFEITSLNTEAMENAVDHRVLVRRDVSRTMQRNWENARIYLHGKIRPDLSL